MTTKAAKKPATRKKAAKTAARKPRLDPGLVENAITLLLALDSPHQVRAALTAQLHTTPAMAEALLAEARRRLALAAGYDKVEELGRAIKRLNDLYSRSLRIQDTKTALASQKEINRLLSLGANSGQSAATAGGDDPPGDQREIAAYLRPAIDPGGTLPVEELARLAANEIAELRAARA